MNLPAILTGAGAGLIGCCCYLAAHHTVLRLIARRHERREAEQFAIAVEARLRKGIL